MIALEAGKPIKQARVEVGRSAATFAAAADEATRFHDEVLHLDATPGGEGRQGIVRRFPIGPIAAISPFNFPLNLVAHKLAPAIAAGCPVVLKPASQTPISALTLAGIILEAGWPAAALSVLPMNSKDATALVEDDRFKLLTFTGSPVVGWDMKRRAGRKRVTLELGGNAGCIVHSDADLAFAAERWRWAATPTPARAASASSACLCTSRSTKSLWTASCPRCARSKSATRWTRRPTLAR